MSPDAPSAAEMPGLRTGRVTACSSDNWLIREAGGSHRLRRAASCLLVPAAGDTVAWMPGAGDAAGWIVAVLERGAESAGQPLQLRTDGDVAWQVDGQWSMRATRLRVDADAAELHLRDVRMNFDAFRSVGRLVQATVTQTRWVGQELCAVVERWFQHSTTHHRRTEGLEQARAGTMDLHADQLVRVEAPQVLTEASTLAKTRGGQIHFG